LITNLCDVHSSATLCIRGSGTSDSSRCIFLDFFFLITRAFLAVAVFVVLLCLLGFLDLEVLVVLNVLVEVLWGSLVAKTIRCPIDVAAEHLGVVRGLGVLLHHVLETGVLDLVEVVTEVSCVLGHAVGGLFPGTLVHRLPDGVHE
jgi:hypothetical protein